MNFWSRKVGALVVVRKGKRYRISDGVHTADIIAPTFTEAVNEWAGQRELLQRNKPFRGAVAPQPDRGRGDT